MANTPAPPDQAGLSAEDLDELTRQVRNLFVVEDRRYGFPARTYAQCFVGSQAVAAMVGAGIAADAKHAVQIGNLLLQAGVFRHVLDEHPFRDDELFYRFAADAGHGEAAQRADGSDVSWADLLGPAGDAPDDRSMQPRMPARDPMLGSFAQDELDAIGVAPLDAHNVSLLDNVHPRSWVAPTPKPRYNLVVIGAGAGGLVSSAAAAGLGAHVALVESHLLGGDCLNVGCVPSKALLRCAKVAATARHAADFGVRVGDVEVDFAAVMARMRKLRAAIAPNDSATRYARDLGVDVFFGRGKFSAPDAVEVNGQTLRFGKAIIATGATAAIPPIPGLQDAPFLTNATVFNLTERPSRLAVIGAGAIGMELAQAFRRLGSEVTVFYRGKLLPKEDRDAAGIVAASMQRDGVAFQQVKQYTRVDSAKGKPPVRVTFETASAGAQTLEFDALLLATGRKPAVANLGLEAAGVEFDARSGIKVSNRLQTSNPHIYAVGDIASAYQFTHMSDFMARIAIRNALFLGRDKASSLLVPWATYTDPELAHVGLHEADLQERQIEFVVFERHFGDVDRTLLEGETEGFVKFLVRKGSDEILGATIVGPHAGDMISEVSVAMRARMGLGTLATVIHPYPTAAEAIRQCGDAYNRTRLTPTVRKVFNRLMALRR